MCQYDKVLGAELVILLNVVAKLDPIVFEGCLTVRWLRRHCIVDFVV
jgi:hypothetical protein